MTTISSLGTPSTGYTPSDSTLPQMHFSKPSVASRPQSPSLSRTAPARPTLPQFCIALAEEEHKTYEENFKRTLARMNLERQYQNRLQNEYTTLIENSSEKEANITYLGQIKSIGGALMSASSLLSGGALLASTGGAAVIPATALISSGAAGILSNVLSFFDGYSTTSGYLSLASAALSIGGGILGHSLMTQNMPNLVLNIINGGLSIATATTNFSQAMTQKELNYLQEQQERLRSALKSSELQTAKLHEQMQEISSRINEIHEVVREVLVMNGIALRQTAIGS